MIDNNRLLKQAFQMQPNDTSSIQQKRRIVTIREENTGREIKSGKSQEGISEKTKMHGRCHNKDKTGQTSGSFRVTGRSHQDSVGRWFWKMKCACGNTKVVAGNQLHLRGHCLVCAVHPNQTHGMRYTPEYSVWNGMRRRCEEVCNKDYPRYGGAGVRISADWHSFENFIKDMGPRPSGLHQIDRIDTTGHYSKENCRWATISENQSNRKNSAWWMIKGIKFLNCQEAARHFNVADTTVCRWVYGAFDKRRNTTTPARKDCYLIQKYENT